MQCALGGEVLRCALGIIGIGQDFIGRVRLKILHNSAEFPVWRHLARQSYPLPAFLAVAEAGLLPRDAAALEPGHCRPGIHGEHFHKNIRVLGEQGPGLRSAVTGDIHPGSVCEIVNL